jgi:beta-xylosidase
MINMKHFTLTIILLSFLTISNYSQIVLSDKAADHYYTNPIITGMNPDPSICRVGEDYYLVTSTFGFYPGLPIYHSRDLVNWRMIGYGIDRPSQLKLRESHLDQLNLFAATIRHHEGVFYIINTNTGRLSDTRNFVITATNPAGPWSEAHYIENAPLIDPSLFFDKDGKELNLSWNFIQTPDNQWWNLEDPSGHLSIMLRPEIISNGVNPSFIGRRQAHKNFTAVTKMEALEQHFSFNFSEDGRNWEMLRASIGLNTPDFDF